MTAIRRQGFSLLEVLIAMMLAGLMAGLMFAMYGVMLRALLLSSRTVQAQGVAERAILTAQAHPCAWVDLASEPVVVLDEGIPFERTIVVEALPGGPDLWKFHATVSWRQLNRRHQIQLMTHRAYYGLLCPQWVPPYGRP